MVFGLQLLYGDFENSLNSGSVEEYYRLNMNPQSKGVKNKFKILGLLALSLLGYDFARRRRKRRRNNER